MIYLVLLWQRLEFLGDAVLDYLITSYLFSVYPKLKPGQLTDLRSVCVNNKAFAHVAVDRNFHKFLIHDSSALSNAIQEFEEYTKKPASDRGPLEAVRCPKVRSVGFLPNILNWMLVKSICSGPFVH